VTLAGAIAFLAFRGFESAAGFLMGAIVSLLNFQGMSAVVNLLLGLKRPAPFAIVLILLRYGLVGCAVYVIVKILGFTLAPVISGLFAAFAAVVLETLYELISRPANH